MYDLRPNENQPPIPSSRVAFVHIQNTQDHPIRLRYTRLLPCSISHFFWVRRVRDGASSEHGTSRYARYSLHRWVFWGWAIATASLPISPTDWRIRASRTELTSSPSVAQWRIPDGRSTLAGGVGRDSAGRRRASTDRCCGPDTRRAKTSVLLRARPLEAAQATESSGARCPT